MDSKEAKLLLILPGSDLTATPDTLLNWEKNFSDLVQNTELIARAKAGVLLSVIPNHTQWEDFLRTVRTEWKMWRKDLSQNPACVLMLYCGLAFYEYEDNRFWPQFSKSIGSMLLPPNRQNECNDAFAKGVQHFGLKLKDRGIGTDYVGSAVLYIGIPLSLWSGFLDICEWALWRKDWKTLSDEEWKEAIQKRTGGRVRLKRFLIDNRTSASSFLQDMLDARSILTSDPSLTINNIAQASILRIEYFDEVPETAEFLRPKNPDSLFRDHARIIWAEQRKQICLQLPAVARDKLPATWSVGAQSQNAAPSPDLLVLNSQAFCNPILLNLSVGGNCESQRLRGLEPWGLFDMENGGSLVNPNRDDLPLKSYVLVSQRELRFLSCEGFEVEENPPNERFELADGKTCFITRLWPTGWWAKLQIKEDGGNTKTIQFRTREKIEAQFFAGKGVRAAYFNRIQGIVKIEQWPVLCASIPRGYFRDDKSELKEKFKVFIDDQPAAGKWESTTMQTSNDREYYFWEWCSSRPVMAQIKSGTVSSLQDLPGFFYAPSLKGNRVLSIKSSGFTIQYKIYKDEPKHGMDKCWMNLPGTFLPMFLLCQWVEGMKWEHLVLAKDVIAPHLRLSYYLLRKYADYGFLAQKGHRWFIRESCAELKPMDHDLCEMNFCGDPSILWGLYRFMYHQMQGKELPVIAVIDKRNSVPYLQMIWPLILRGELEKYLRRHHVVIRKTLWIH